MSAARTFVSFAALIGLGCHGPFGLLPGGALPGDVAPAPADWSFAGDSGTLQLETDPAEPYSVNVAYTVQGGALYVNAGDTETNWVKNIAADPRVRLRIDGALYAARAERVTDQAAIDAFAEAWNGQSFFRRDPRALSGPAWIYRMVAR